MSSSHRFGQWVITVAILFMLLFTARAQQTSHVKWVDAPRHLAANCIAQELLKTLVKLSK